MVSFFFFSLRSLFSFFLFFFFSFFLFFFIFFHCFFKKKKIKGIPVYDAFQKDHFVQKVKLSLISSDLLALCDLLGTRYPTAKNVIKFDPTFNFFFFFQIVITCELNIDLWILFETKG